MPRCKMISFDLHYYQDPYCREFDSKVVSCEEDSDRWKVVLSDTIFYCEGGGQPSDTGYLDEAEVLLVKEVNGTPVHYCDRPLEVGKTVRGKIDWQRRYQHMQNHSGEHVVSGLVHKNFGYDNVGFHMGQFIQLDFNGPMSWEEALEIERQANEVIDENIEIRECFPTDEELQDLDYRSKKELSGQVRIVDIEGADRCACCGTHVRGTGEIGAVKVLSLEKHKNGVRMMILCGSRLRDYLAAIYEQNRQISNLLSAAPLRTAEYVERMLQRNHELSGQLNRFKEETLLASLAKAGRERVHILFTQDIDKPILTRYGNEALSCEKAEVAALFNRREDGWEYLIMSQKVNLRDFSGEINRRLNGRGGGRPDIIQGVVSAEKEEIEKLMKELFG
ncbi:MAG: alanyl-tRNA editing protein [Erysipelotrichaceae bacterium]|nr:alanyl-tRNA editing protein [Erysipelotrichaceae bacterium]